MRKLVFALCTLLSLPGLFRSSVQIAFPFVLIKITNGDFSYNPSASIPQLADSILMAFIHVFAWFYYFKAGWLWINNKSVTKKFAITGLLLGLISSYRMYSFAVFFLPSMVLIFYITFLEGRILSKKSENI